MLILPNTEIIIILSFFEIDFENIKKKCKKVQKIIFFLFQKYKK